MKARNLVWLYGTVAFALLAPGLAKAGNCAALKQTAFPGAKITGAHLTAAGPFVLPAELGPARTVQLPAFCRVQGVLRPTSDSEIAFEVWLPASDWNGRFQGIGNGGFAGSISYSALATALQDSDAAAATDTGHKAFGTDASWAKGHPEKIVDFGWRAVHLTAVIGKALTRAFYGARPHRSYFMSCSNGGRQGLMEAQRFPDDYDGIIAGAPAYNWTGLFTDFVWNAQALSRPGAWVPAAKTPAIAAAVLASCDKRDGLADGLLSDPRQCRFDPEKLKCSGKVSAACLTNPQIGALRAIYEGPHKSDGQRIDFGFLPGGEAAPGSAGWDLWIFGSAPRTSIQYAFASNFMKDFVGAPENWTPADFDFDRDFDSLRAKMSVVLDATNPDLSRFASHGGKLILFQGWSDAAIPPQGTIAYRDRVTHILGAARAASFMRLFMVPGMHHCGGGTGASDFGQNGVSAANRNPETDLAAALEAWVERGRTPNQVIARQTPGPVAARGPSPTERPNGGQRVRTGLICAYPRHASLNPGADPAQAQSYRCVEP
ncbi:MAG: tannase/feruloyl esterase family alpha/beta hydrolase [Steroidobacteraceae bacterium]